MQLFSEEGLPETAVKARKCPFIMAVAIVNPQAWGKGGKKGNLKFIIIIIIYRNANTKAWNYWGVQPLPPLPLPMNQKEYLPK